MKLLCKIFGHRWRFAEVPAPKGFIDFVESKEPFLIASLGITPTVPVMACSRCEAIHPIFSAIMDAKLTVGAKELAKVRSAEKARLN